MARSAWGGAAQLAWFGDALGKAKPRHSVAVAPGSGGLRHGAI